MSGLWLSTWLDFWLDSNSDLSRFLAWLASWLASIPGLTRFLTWLNSWLDPIPDLSRFLAWLVYCLDSIPDLTQFSTSVDSWLDSITDMTWLVFLIDSSQRSTQVKLQKNQSSQNPALYLFWNVDSAPDYSRKRFWRSPWLQAIYSIAELMLKEVCKVSESTAKMKIWGFNFLGIFKSSTWKLAQYSSKSCSRN